MRTLIVQQKGFVFMSDISFCFSYMQLEKMIVGEKLDSSTNKKSLYASVEYQGYTYKVGGGCFLDPDTYSYKYKKTRKSTYKDLSSKVKLPYFIST